LLAKIGVETSGSESRFNIDFKEGDRVVVKKDSFYDQTGEISSIDYEHGRVTVMLEVFGRLTPVELEYNEVEKSEY
jgi:transcription termination/antitermination factor NusG